MNNKKQNVKEIDKIFKTKLKTVTKESKYSYCNHFHELTDKYEIVDFGTGKFVANKEAIPLLKSLNELGLKTRTHHIEKNQNCFFSIILDNLDYKIVDVIERNSTRDSFDGKKEILFKFFYKDEQKAK